ncbi:MAG: type III pantothenate kinase, partial [Planctomycetia bacterium]
PRGVGDPPGAGLGRIVVADVGNSRIKLAVVAGLATGCVAGGHAEGGRTDGGHAEGLPKLAGHRAIDSRDFNPDGVTRWLGQLGTESATVLVASVNDTAAARLEAALGEFSVTKHRPLRQRRITAAHLPLGVALPHPQRVGIDRLAAAAAAAVVKRPGKPAVVVNCGTAATVDIVAPDGTFLGGAILPGPALLARALAEGTSRLPAVTLLEQGPPPALPGRSTEDAIAAGIGWGSRGAVGRLVAEATRAAGTDADVILTGGWSHAIRDDLPAAIEVPDLVLAGIALAAPRALAR